MIYFKIIAIALALYIFSRSVSSFFRIINNRGKIRYAFLRIFPVVEMLLWLAFAFFATYQLFGEFSFYPVLTLIMIVVLIIIFGWYFLRDFFSGIILKSENAFEPGQIIIAPNVSGIIKKLGYRSMEIVSKEGETVKIPYNLLSEKYIIKPADSGSGIGKEVNFKISSGFQADKIRDMFRKRIIEMPWIISEKDISIKISSEGAGIYMVNIYFYSITSDLTLKTKENLQHFINEVFASNL